MKDWAKWDRDAEAAQAQMIADAKRRSAADHEFFTAVERARLSARNDDLFPIRTEHGELKYLPRQGIMAACFAREDAAVAATLQLAILRRLDRNRNLTIIAIILLLFVSYRLL